MEILPHIKIIIDDLVTMTKNISVKRQDIADRYETNLDTISLYNKYRTIINGNGEDTFYSYSNYPRSLLRACGEWKQLTIKDSDLFDKKLGPAILNSAEGDYLDYSTLSNDKPLTVSYNIKTDGEQNTLMNYPTDGSLYLFVNWFRNRDDTSNYIFNSLIKYEKSKIDQNVKVLKYTKSYNPNTNSYDYLLNPNDEVPNGATIYIYDNALLEFVEVKYSYETVYIGYDAAELDTPLRKYCRDSSSNIYKLSLFDKYEYPEYFVDTEADDPNKYYYTIRTDIRISYVEDKYYDINNIYVAENDTTTDLTEYARIDNNEYYYDEESGLYLLIYEEDDNGDYVFDYDSYEYVKREATEGEIRYKKVIENVTVYKYYAPAVDGLVDIDEIFEIDGTIIDRYVKNDDGSIQLYYNKNFDSICSIYVENLNESIEWYNYIKHSATTEGSETTYRFNNEENFYDNDNNILYVYLKSSIDSLSGSNRLKYECSKPYLRINTNIDDMYVYKRAIYPISEGSVEYVLSRYYDSELCLDTVWWQWNSKDYAGSDKAQIKLYQYSKAFTNYDIELYATDKTLIPEKWHKTLLTFIREYVKKQYCPSVGDESYSVPLYIGETNLYYRTLNGLPPLNSNIENPKIPRSKIYESTDVNDWNGQTKAMPYLYELTDKEYNIIVEKGYFDQFKRQYPSLDYLNYLGSNRIDVVTAREANMFDIIRIDDDYVDSFSRELFVTYYKIAKNYIINKYYKPNMFGGQAYYIPFIGYLICILTFNLVVSNSDRVLIEDKYRDEDTIENVLASYGFGEKFRELPVKYRGLLARNINKLIRNKGIDNIYNVIDSMFKNANIQILRYLVKKTTDSDGFANIVFIPSSIESDSMSSDIRDTISSISYETYTNTDPYWDPYNTGNTKNRYLNMNADYAFSKYLSIQQSTHVHKIAFYYTYFINYLYDMENFDVDGKSSTTIGIIDVSYKDVSVSDTISNTIKALWALNEIDELYTRILSNRNDRFNNPSIDHTYRINKFNPTRSILNKYEFDYINDILTDDVNATLISKSIENGSDIETKLTRLKNIITYIVQYNENSHRCIVPNVIRSDVEIAAKNFIYSITNDYNNNANDDKNIINYLQWYRLTTKDYISYMIFDQMYNAIATMPASDIFRSTNIADLKWYNELRSLSDKPTTITNIILSTVEYDESSGEITGINGDLLRTYRSDILEAINKYLLELNMELSYGTSENELVYIKKILDTFKSYSVQVIESGTIYEIDDVNRNTIRIFDEVMGTSEVSYATDNLLLSSEVETIENYVFDGARLNIHDELSVEYKGTREYIIN